MVENLIVARSTIHDYMVFLRLQKVMAQPIKLRLSLTLRGLFHSHSIWTLEIWQSQLFTFYSCIFSNTVLDLWKTNFFWLTDFCQRTITPWLSTFAREWKLTKIDPTKEVLLWQTWFKAQQAAIAAKSAPRDPCLPLFPNLVTFLLSVSFSTQLDLVLISVFKLK